jgi:hypothetical protein
LGWITDLQSLWHSRLASSRPHNPLLAGNECCRHDRRLLRHFGLAFAGFNCPIVMRASLWVRLARPLRLILASEPSAIDVMAARPIRVVARRAQRAFVAFAREPLGRPPSMAVRLDIIDEHLTSPIGLLQSGKQATAGGTAFRAEAGGNSPPISTHPLSQGPLRAAASFRFNRRSDLMVL